MNRKITVLTFCAMLFALCFAAQAQDAKKVSQIGFLTLIPGPDPLELIFLQSLRELGYDEGRNITIEYRRAAGKVENLPKLAEELVRLKVDLIVVRATPVGPGGQKTRRQRSRL
jgi:putative tryptophan/tyrosine transport system substrate-binding protein